MLSVLIQALRYHFGRRLHNHFDDLHAVVLVADFHFDFVDFRDLHSVVALVSCFDCYDFYFVLNVVSCDFLLVDLHLETDDFLYGNEHQNY